jgi:hypothetical protein
MHSVYVTLSLKEAAFPDENARRAHLERVVAEVSAKPGFVHGYWLAPTEGLAHSILFYDTEENAIAGAPAPDSEHSGVARITNVDLAPVVASA